MAVLVCRERRRAARSAQPPFRCGRYVTEDSTAGAPTPAELTQKFEQKVKSAGTAGVTISGFKVRRSAQHDASLWHDGVTISCPNMAVESSPLHGGGG